jgi:hypothetical protein
MPGIEKIIIYGRYLLYLALYILVQTFILNGLSEAPFSILLIDGLLYGSVLILVGVFIWRVLVFGNFEALTIFQKLSNTIGLGIFSIIVWLSTAYALKNLLTNKLTLSLSTQYLPLKSVIGSLCYLLLVQHFQLQNLKNKPKEIEPTVEELAQKTERTTTDFLDRITVKSGTKIHVIETPDILYLQADGDYVQIHTSEGKYLKEQTMKYFEEHLPENKFVRVHRSFLVNIEMISRIELHEKLNQQLTLKNGDQIKTSIAGYKALKVALKL